MRRGASGCARLTRTSVGPLVLSLPQSGQRTPEAIGVQGLLCRECVTRVIVSAPKFGDRVIGSRVCICPPNSLGCFPRTETFLYLTLFNLSVPSQCLAHSWCDKTVLISVTPSSLPSPPHTHIHTMYTTVLIKNCFDFWGSVRPHLCARSHTFCKKIVIATPGHAETSCFFSLCSVIIGLVSAKFTCAQGPSPRSWGVQTSAWGRRGSRAQPYGLPVARSLRAVTSSRPCKFLS